MEANVPDVADAVPPTGLDGGADGDAIAVPLIPAGGLALWLAADDGLTLTPFLTWRDRSGRGRDAVSHPQAAQPQVMAGWPRLPDAMAIGFPGGSGIEDPVGPDFAADLRWIASADGFVIFVVAAPRLGSSAFYGGIVSAGSRPFTPTCCGDEGRALQLGTFLDAGADAGVFLDRTCGSVTTTAEALSDSRLLRFGYSPSLELYTMAENGKLFDDDGAMPCRASAQPKDPGDAGHVGGNAGGGCVGLIGEVIGYQRELNDAEIATVEAYLRAKWATP